MRKEFFIGLVSIAALSILWAWRTPGPYQMVVVDGGIVVCDTQTGETWVQYKNYIRHVDIKTGEVVEKIYTKTE